MARLTMVLFHEGPGDASDTLAAILNDVVHDGADGHSIREVDVHDHPALAARYNVRTTPTILLMKEGQVVDRVIGTPTTILLQNLLDTRADAPKTTRVA